MGTRSGVRARAGAAAPRAVAPLRRVAVSPTPRPAATPATPRAPAAFTGPVRHLYVHVPFCAARCDYCDYFSLVVPPDGGRGGGRRAGADEWTREEDRSGAEERAGASPTPGAPRARSSRAALLDAYVTTVTAEWERERAAHGVRRLETLYFGGGTPALLGVERLERLVSAFAACLTPGAEVTVETNADEADEAFAAWAAARGVRVSLGVQSFAAKSRAALGRRPAADPAAAARRLRAAGVGDLSLDLIWGIPGQTVDDLEADLAQVAALAPDHVSCYELDVAPGTPLARRFAGAPPPAGDERAALFGLVVRGLTRLGYRWYEVSSFARPRHRARHNVAYWCARPYLGLGPGAVSTVGRRRWRNAPDLVAYLGAPGRPPRTVEGLDDATVARERLMLAARCGLPVPVIEVAVGIELSALGPLWRAGLLSLHSGTIRVTRKGRSVANEVCVRLFRA